MKLVWITDAHIDHVKRERLDDVILAITGPEPDALLLTGDIAEAPTLKAYLAWLHAKLEIPIYFVLGNHDFYGGSVDGVTSAARGLTTQLDRLFYVPDGVFDLAQDGGFTVLEPTCLIGVNAWCDGRAGDPYGSTVGMCDWDLIQDLKQFKLTVYRAQLLQKYQSLAQRDADLAAVRLTQAMAEYKRVFFACHIPPWPEATWHQGKQSDKDWLPWFCSVVLGQTIVEVASRFPESRVTVLCGHTHGAGEYQAAPNVTALTGAAAYGEPWKHVRIIDA